MIIDVFPCKWFFGGRPSAKKPQKNLYFSLFGASLGVRNPPVGWYVSGEEQTGQ